MDQHIEEANKNIKEAFYGILARSIHFILLTGTEKVSSIWNSGGSDRLYGSLVDSKFINIFSRSRFSPVTLETWKIGHILQKKKINFNKANRITTQRKNY